MADKTTTVNIDTMAVESKQAAEGIANFLFGGSEEPEIEEQEEEDEPAETDDDKPEQSEEEESEEEESEEGEESDDDDDSEEEGEEDDKPEADITDLLEPIADFIPEGTEIKTVAEYKAFVGDLAKQYREKEDALKKEVESNDILIDLFESHPELASITRALSRNKGMSFQQAVYNVIDPADVVPDKTKDPEAYADYIVAKKEREREQARAKEEFDRNLQQSDSVIESFRKSNDFDTGTINTIMNKAQDFLRDIQSGKVTKEYLQVLAKGMNFDTAVQQAAAKGEVKGKNEAANKAKQRKKGDGLPKPKNVAGGKASKPKTSTDPMQEMLAETFRAASNPFYR